MAENGWPIIVKRDAWKTASIVGFTSGKDSIFIDKGAKNWVARTLSKSMEVQDMPSCRGSGWFFKIIFVKNRNYFKCNFFLPKAKVVDRQRCITSVFQLNSIYCSPKSQNRML